MELETQRLFQVHPDGYNSAELTGRMYEYFTTIYCQERKCIMNGLDIGHDFLRACATFKKKQFQPFRRGGNLIYISPPSPSKGVGQLVCTEAQLNFLTWVIQSHTDKYILEHFDEIRAQKFVDKNKKIKNVVYIDPDVLSKKQSIKKLKNINKTAEKKVGQAKPKKTTNIKNSAKQSHIANSHAALDAQDAYLLAKQRAAEKDAAIQKRVIALEEKRALVERRKQERKEKKEIEAQKKKAQKKERALAQKKKMDDLAESLENLSLVSAGKSTTTPATKKIKTPKVSKTVKKPKSETTPTANATATAVTTPKRRKSVLGIPDDSIHSKNKILIPTWHHAPSGTPSFRKRLGF